MFAMLVDNRQKCFCQQFHDKSFVDTSPTTHTPCYCCLFLIMLQNILITGGGKIMIFVTKINRLVNQIGRLKHWYFCSFTVSTQQSKHLVHV